MKYQHVMIDIPECELMSIQENVTDWRPGKRIRVTRDPLWLPFGCLVMLLVVPAIVVGIGYAVNSLTSALMVAGLIGVIEIVIFVIPFFKESGRKDIVFDWELDALHYQFGRKQFETSLEDIEAVIIETEQHSSDPIRSSAKMKIRVHRQEHEVFETYQADVTPLNSTASIVRVGERLAECLDVPVQLSGIINERSVNFEDVLSAAKTNEEVAGKYASLGTLCEGYFHSCEFRGLMDEAKIHKAEAIDHYMRAYELDPTQASPLLRLGELSNNPDIQERAIRTAMQSTDHITPSLELGYLRLRNDEYEEAMQIFSEIIEKEPSADAYNGRANVFESLEQYQDAIHDVTSAIELDPDEPANYSNRGRLTLELYDNSTNRRDLEDVLADYEKAVQLDPESASFQIARAEVWHKLGRVDEAIAEFDRIVSDDPEDFYRYSRRGQLFLEDGRWPESAIDDFTRVIELLETERPSAESRGRFLHLDSLAFAYEFRAEAHRRMGNFQQAIADEQRSEELFDECE